MRQRNRPDPDGGPHPPTPHAARIAEAYKLRHQLMDPGSLDCPGFIFMAVKTVQMRISNFAGECVRPVTRLRWSPPV
jgi:hypothetical protein